MKQILFTFCILLLLGCASDQVAKKTQEQKQFAQETNDEITIGRAMAAKLIGTYGYYEKSEGLLQYINLVGLSVAAQGGRPELKYQFGILNTDEINAFATPGGYIFVTKGLLKNLKNESELGCVLAHEVAHVTQKHMYKDIMPKRESSAGETLTRILSRGSADIANSMSKAVSAGMDILLQKGYGKEKEYEADSVGVMYATATGYNPHSLAGVIDRVEKAGNHEVMNKTHPSSAERISLLNNFLKTNGLTDAMTAKEEVINRRFTATMNLL